METNTKDTLDEPTRGFPPPKFSNRPLNAHPGGTFCFKIKIKILVIFSFFSFFSNKNGELVMPDVALAFIASSQTEKTTSNQVTHEELLLVYIA